MFPSAKSICETSLMGLLSETPRVPPRIRWEFNTLDCPWGGEFAIQLSLGVTGIFPLSDLEELRNVSHF